MTRPYRSARRAEAAEATRELIVAAARRLFLERGYGEVTVGDIASAAQVAPQTVYASMGGKAAILACLLRAAVEDPAVEETSSAIGATEDPKKIVDLTAAGTRRAHERHWELLSGLLRYAHTESAAQDVVREADTAFAAELNSVIDHLEALDALAIDRTLAADLLWFHVGHQAWFTLVGDRGWSFDRAESWLGAAARHALLRDPGDPADMSTTGKRIDNHTEERP